MTSLKHFLIFSLFALVLLAVSAYYNWPWYFVGLSVLVLLSSALFMLYRNYKKKHVLIFAILLLSAGLIIALINLQLFLSYELAPKPSRPMDARIWNMGSDTHNVRLTVVNSSGTEIFNKSYIVNGGKSIGIGPITWIPRNYSVIVEVDGKGVNHG